MSRSEIFNNYFKIAQDKGILSESDKAAKELQKTRRMDSLSIEAIEKLYNLKPEKSEGLDYKNNIMESAHPDSLVLSPAYDKLNGLVENNIERQNIMLRIVNKNPDGLLTQRKYAEKALILSLVRTANNLDNQDKNELRTLADSCLYLITKTAKTALANFAIAGLVGGAVGLMYLISRLNTTDRGFEKNHEHLVQQLTDLLEEDINFLGFGFELTDEGRADITNVISQLNKFKSEYDSYKPIFALAFRANNLAQITESASKNPQLYQQIQTIYNSINNSIKNITPLLDNLNKFNNPEVIATYVKKQGATSNWLESWYIYGDKSSWSLIPGEFQDVVKSMPTYKESLNNILKAANDAKKAVDTSTRYVEADIMQKQIQSTLPQFQGLTGPDSPLAAPTGTAGATPLPTYLQYNQFPTAPGVRSTAPEYSANQNVPSATSQQYGQAQPSATSTQFGGGSPTSTTSEYEGKKTNPMFEHLPRLFDNISP